VIYHLYTIGAGEPDYGGNGAWEREYLCLSVLGKYFETFPHWICRGISGVVCRLGGLYRVSARLLISSVRIRSTAPILTQPLLWADMPSHHGPRWKLLNDLKATPALRGHR